MLKFLRSLTGRGREAEPELLSREPTSLSVAICEVGQGSTVEVSHQRCAEPLPREESVLELFEKEESEFTTVSVISIIGPAIDFRAHVYWWPVEYSSICLSLLFIESTRRLFVGVGELLAAVDVESPKVLSTHPTLLFWSFEYTHGCVLARSELECFLFLPTGVLSGSVPVDPPWIEQVGEAGIEFDSPVYGRHVLAWPGAT